MSIDGTYRSCLLQNVKANNSCENQNSEFPIDDPFRGVVLEEVKDVVVKGVPVAVNSTIFKGKKCVSDEAGRFPLNWKDNSNGAIALKLNLFSSVSFHLHILCSCDRSWSNILTKERDLDTPRRC